MEPDHQWGGTALIIPGRIETSAGWICTLNAVLRCLRNLIA